MLSILPLAVLVLVAWIAAGARRGKLRFDLRDALLVGAVAVGVWGAAGAELLSSVHAFAKQPVVFWWLVPAVGLALWLVLRSSPVAMVRLPADGLTVRLRLATAAVLCITGAVALLTPPNTWDSLCYHLPRQMYWIENGTVAHYPALDLRQLEMPPLAEFIGAQLMLLSGTDHQANLVQWFSFLLGAMAASAIARDLGAGTRGQALAALLTVVNPAAAMQAENAKNDLMLALWALILAWAATRIWLAGSCRVRDAALVGLTLGLLLLTKGTGYALAPPLCVVIGAAAVRACRWRAVPLGTAMIVLAAGLNAGHWWRNAAEFGSPLALPAARGGHDLTNTTFSPAAVASTAIRNVALHTATPWESVNAWQMRAIGVAHRILKIDESDPRTTSPRNERFVVHPARFRDGQVGSPLHLGLGAVLGVWLLVRARRIRSLPVWPLWLVPFAAALLFCVVLKWQPWHIRLHIPFLALLAPLIGAWLDRRAVWIGACGWMGVAMTVPALVWNEAKPLAGPMSILSATRSQILFHSNTRTLAGAQEAIEHLALHRPANVGINVASHTYEYAVMRLMLDTLSPRPRFVCGRPNFGRALHTRDGPVDAMLVGGEGAAGPIHDSITRDLMVPSFVGRKFKVYVPASTITREWAGCTLPAFSGWSACEGLGRTEGPYEHWKLPEVRWAIAPKVTLNFESDGSPASLRIEARRNDRLDQEITIRLNGERVWGLALGPIFEFIPIRIRLAPRAGANTVTMEYANTGASGPPRAVLFRRLQIVPEARPAEPSATPP